MLPLFFSLFAFVFVVVVVEICFVWRFSFVVVLVVIDSLKNQIWLGNNLKLLLLFIFCSCY